MEMENHSDGTQTKNQPAGEVNDINSPLEQDILAECLAVITRHYEKPRSPETLIAGLPLENSQLTPELFLRAAERAGYESALDELSLDELHHQSLPLVLLLNNRSACVVHQVKDDGDIVITVPGAERSSVTIDSLRASYSGYGLQVKPVYGFDDEGDAFREHWFWGTIKKMWQVYAEIIVASLLINLFALAVPMFVMNVYDRVVPNHAVETLWVLASGVSVVLLFDILMKSLRSHFIDNAGRYSDIMLSRQVFAHVLGIKLDHRPDKTGSFVNNLLEFDTFREFFTSTTIAVLIDLPFVLLFILVIANIGGFIAWIPAVAVAVALGFGLLMQFPLRRVIQQTYQDSARKHAGLVETISGLEAIKSLGAEGTVQRRWEEQIETLANLKVKSKHLSTTITNSSQFIQQVAYIILIISGVYQITAGNLTMGGLIACSILSGRALAPMAQVSNLLTRFHQSVSAYRSLDGIMAMPGERGSTQHFLQREKLKGSIEFKNVKFAYPGQELNSLEDISFKIQPGERVGIVGRIGSGKSTIQKLIQGFYDTSEGSILVDNTDIRQIDPSDLRRNIGASPQDIILFSGSVKDNIVLGVNNADDGAVLRAAEIAGISEFLQQHPQGFDLQVGERGINLSGGQRQSIALARTIMRDPEIVLLDEPTNAFDSTTEEQFLKHFHQWLGQRTLVMATHKATPLALVDRLVVIDKGRIVADGPKQQVVDALAGNQVSTGDAR